MSGDYFDAGFLNHSNLVSGGRLGQHGLEGIFYKIIRRILIYKILAESCHMIVIEVPIQGS